MEKTEILENKATDADGSNTSISTVEQPQPNTKQTTNENVVNKEEHDTEARSKKEKVGRILTFLGLQIALFLAALDNTIVATALPRIGSDFNQMSIVAWVATAYILTFDAFQPLFSKFSDIFGRKWILLFGISIFLLGSVLCGAAKSMIMLIVARAIAGIGAAGIFSMVFVIFSELVPLEKRGSYQGIINAVFALSSVFGPLIGGSLTDYVSWRWNFYINLPIGATAMAVLIVFLKMPTPKDKLSDKLKRVDYVGTLIVLAFATLFLLALNFGGQTFPWKSAAVIVPLVLSVLLVGLLILVEKKFAKEPLMPPRLFKNRSVVSVLITNWFFGMTFFSAVYYLPVYFQVVRNDSAMWSGIRLIPMQMVLCVLSTFSGLFISKTGIYRPLIVSGMTFLTLWIGLTSLYRQDTPWSQVYGITIVGSLGLGSLFSSTIIALQASVPPQDIAVVTGLGNFSRILGGALGVAISSAVLNSQLTQELFKYLPEDQAMAVIQSSEYVNHGLPKEYLDTTLTIYVDALRLIWWVLIPMSGMGLIASLFVKHHSTRSHQKLKEAELKKEQEAQAQEEDLVVVHVPDEEKEEKKEEIEEKEQVKKPEVV
ncbi:major facilitator superfamily domain-containing protein [Gilbertella persicaria]|uniref:major facilitator superfamily domain-containing protein n=1 Tax=Gilbertella persicaria TaxID=101096 RepID=UPI002220C17B|nr:major facilitator superfamily domain-containing protein [Gilbertella persicaria]KAI8081919.1 major facilitator superfamily domain-containing protein [Gilbertella persicaria]